MTLSGCQLSANQETRMNESYPEYISLSQIPCKAIQLEMTLTTMDRTEGARDQL